jgi:hypothetical protein
MDATIKNNETANRREFRKQMTTLKHLGSVHCPNAALLAYLFIRVHSRPFAVNPLPIRASIRG